MSNNQDKKQINLKVEFPEDENLVKYSNFALVSHLHEEFVIDFARILPGKTSAKVIDRIVMTPKSAKMFLNALATNIKNFEDKFGEITPPTMNMNVKPMTDIQ